MLKYFEKYHEGLEIFSIYAYSCSWILTAFLGTSLLTPASDPGLPVNIWTMSLWATSLAFSSFTLYQNWWCALVKRNGRVMRSTPHHDPLPAVLFVCLQSGALSLSFVLSIAGVVLTSDIDEVLGLGEWIGFASTGGVMIIMFIHVIWLQNRRNNTRDDLWGNRQRNPLETAVLKVHLGLK